MNENTNFNNAENSKVERKLMVDTTPQNIVTESKKRVPNKEYTRPAPPKK